MTPKMVETPQDLILKQLKNFRENKKQAALDAKLVKSVVRKSQAKRDNEERRQQLLITQPPISKASIKFMKEYR